MFHYDRDIVIDDIQLWLDSRRKKPFGFISHAHADHIARHRKILCTPATGKLLEKRLKQPDYLALPFHKPFRMNDSTITLFPAGHILGSAQIRIDSSEGTLLYTGDFKIEPSRTVEPFEFVQADILIMESTFGKPSYRTPPRNIVEEQLVETCTRLLRENRVPVVFAYMLGKGQEALKILTDAGLPVAVDFSILNFISVYTAFGVSFEPFEKFRRSEFRGHILLLPPAFRYHRYIKSLPGIYTIYLSGWGMDENAAGRLGVDRVIPLSDHADYDQLMRLVRTIRPKEIYCTHGMASFVQSLTGEGYNAFELL